MERSGKVSGREHLGKREVEATVVTTYVFDRRVYRFSLGMVDLRRSVPVALRHRSRRDVLALASNNALEMARVGNGAVRSAKWRARNVGGR
jgi:hypothetical protein